MKRAWTGIILLIVACSAACGAKSRPDGKETSPGTIAPTSPAPTQQATTEPATREGTSPPRAEQDVVAAPDNAEPPDAAVAPRGAEAYGAKATAAFVDRYSFDQMDGEMDPTTELPEVLQQPRPDGPKLSDEALVHPVRGVVWGPNTDKPITEVSLYYLKPALRVETTKTTNPMSALYSLVPVSPIGECQRGACLLDNGAWVAVRVEDGKEYLAGVFPEANLEKNRDFGEDPLFTKWLDALEAAWGPAWT